MKTDVESWQVRLLLMYLRALVDLQVPGRTFGPKARLVNAVRRNLTSEEREALKRVMASRSRLNQSHRMIELVDHGAGVSSVLGQSRKPTDRSVESIYRSSAIPHWWGVFLFRLVRSLRPRKVLELGTNLGVSAAYIQSALDLNKESGHLTSIEGDPTLASIAAETVQLATSSRVEIIRGRFQEKLIPALKKLGSPDLIFIDGHHEYQATLDYTTTIMPFLGPQSCLVFDDIYLWSRPVRNAWKQILKENSKALSIDCAKLGLLFPQTSSS